MKTYFSSWIKTARAKVPLVFLTLAASTSVGYLNEMHQLNVTEPLLLLVITAALLIAFAKTNNLSFAGPSELAFLGFVIYVVIKSILKNAFDISSISYLLFAVLLYYGFKSFFAENKNPASSIMLAITTAIILLAYLFFAAYHCYVENDTLTNFFTPNKSIFSILLAAQMVFVLPLFLYDKAKLLQALRRPFIAVFFGDLILLACTQGRAGWLGLLLALVYIVYQNQSVPKIKKIIRYTLTPLFSLIFYVLFFYKQGSSAGRILIYKVAAIILKDNWLWGIGQGQFKVQYNEYQAAYFAAHNINSKEALLADNTFYAFNDFLQAAIENGVVAFLILATAIYLLIKQIKNTTINNENKHLLTASIASLVCIATGSLFSYPFQIFPVAVQAILCLAVINSFSPQQSIQLSQPRIKITKVVLLLISFLLLTHFSFYFYYIYKSNLAFALKRNGFKQAAIEQYANLSDSYIKDGSVWFHYAQELYYSNQLVKAKQVINVAKKYYCSNEVYKLSAAIENDLQNYAQAEKDFTTAVNMVPNKMLSRNNLLDFYIERKDTSNAIFWCRSIVSMPIKIPSEIIQGIQQKAKKTLTEILKSTNKL